MRNITYGLLAILCMQLIACKRGDAPDISFYYWKTKFRLDSTEHETLQQSEVQRLYVRYFDVGIKDGIPVPLGILDVDSFPKHLTIIPVIYIKNEVFKQSHENLADNILKLLSGMNGRLGISAQEVQFDCDWTDATREAYFNFLTEFKRLSGKTLSATIRLHQVKYKTRTGIPPVDHGVLMYYNMGTIGHDENSIYDEKLAARYINFLKLYDLPLDIALPVFSWGVLMRDNKVVGLLNKTNEVYYDNDTNFTPIRENHYSVKHSIFKSGFYVRQGDEVKVEQVDEKTLRSMAKQLRYRLNEAPREIIFYDLDAYNLKRYDETTFQEVAAAFR